jgi:hypothetical protein
MIRENFKLMLIKSRKKQVHYVLRMHEYVNECFSPYSLITCPPLFLFQCPFIAQKYMKKEAANFTQGKKLEIKEYKRRPLPSSHFVTGVAS